MSSIDHDIAPGAAASLPVTFRLPHKGRDPYFNLGRTWYYGAERAGLLSLIRLRTKGQKRGVTLIKTADVLALLEKAASRPGKEEQTTPTKSPDTF